MKKGIYGFGLLVFLVIFCSQDVLANVTLNVNAKNSILANKIYYTDSATKLQTVTLPWKEKVVYGNVGEIAITVNNKVKGDLIIKVDILSASLTGGKDGAMSVVGAWLKYASTGTFGAKVVVVVTDGESADESAETVDKNTLSSLCLATQLPLNTTISLFNFVTGIRSPSHIIFTAVLVDNAAATSPIVLGVDVQTVFFNYDPSTSAPIWLDLIKSD